MWFDEIMDECSLPVAIPLDSGWDVLLDVRVTVLMDTFKRLTSSYMGACAGLLRTPKGILCHWLIVHFRMLENSSPQ